MITPRRLWALPTRRRKFPQSILDAREQLLLSTDADCRDTVNAAFNIMDREAGSIKVTFGKTRTSIRTVLAEGHGMRSKPKKLDMLVHCTWPKDAVGSFSLSHLAQSLPLAKSLQIPNMDRAEHWTAVYSRAIAGVVAKNDCCVRIDDPYSKRHPDILLNSVPSVQSERINPLCAVGYVPAQSLADLIMITEGWNCDDEVRIHGATYDRCPKIFAEQFHAASRLGVFLQSKTLKRSRNSQQIILASVLGQELYRRSNLRLGMVLDCNRLYPPDENGTSDQLTDDKTKVFPHQDAESMNGFRQG